MLSQGLTKSYGGLLAARFCLGAAEAGLFPGVNYLSELRDSSRAYRFLMPLCTYLSVRMVQTQ